jgi:hypothetical protein
MTYLDHYQLEKHWSSPLTLASSIVEGKTQAAIEQIRQSPLSVLDKSLGNKGLALIHCAAIAGDVAVLDALFKAKVDVNQRDKMGWTAYHHAALNGGWRVWEWFVAHGDDRLRNHRGARPSDLRALAAAPATRVKAPVWSGEEGRDLVWREMRDFSFSRRMTVRAADLVADWLRPITVRRRSRNDPELLAAYRAFCREGRPLVCLWREPRRREWLAVVAQDMPAGTLLGEYTGRYCWGPPPDALHALGQIDAEAGGSAVTRCGDSFPNAVALPLYDVDGLPERWMIVATVSMARGDVVYLNHGGGHRAKEAHVERVLDRMFTFFGCLDLTVTLETMHSLGDHYEPTLVELALIDRIAYIATTPSSLMPLILAERIHVAALHALVTHTRAFRACRPVDPASEERLNDLLFLVDALQERELWVAKVRTALGGIPWQYPEQFDRLLKALNHALYRAEEMDAADFCALLKELCEHVYGVVV